MASSLFPPPTSRKDSGHAIGVGFGSGNKNWLRIAPRILKGGTKNISVPVEVLKIWAHYANQYERYESKNRFVNPFEIDSNIFIDIRFSKKYMTDRRPLEIF